MMLHVTLKLTGSQAQSVFDNVCSAIFFPGRNGEAQMTMSKFGSSEFGNKTDLFSNFTHNDQSNASSDVSDKY